MLDEQELAIHPLVPESVQHNARVRQIPFDRFPYVTSSSVSDRPP